MLIQLAGFELEIRFGLFYLATPAFKLTVSRDFGLGWRIGGIAVCVDW